MKSYTINNIKLGAFVFLGFVLLVIALFYIGNSNSLFRNDAQLKARFSNIKGLQEGNNVLFSGINAGSVKSIVLINGSTIEVTLLIKKEIINHIPIHSTVTIGTDGLMGNKIINITPTLYQKVMVQDGDYLLVDKTADIDQMLTTLSKSNDNIAIISQALKNTILRISKSEVINLLESKELSENIQTSMIHIRKTTENTEMLTSNLQEMVEHVKKGNGAAGILLTNKTFANDLNITLANLKESSAIIKQASMEINGITEGIHKDLASGKGPLPALLRDSILTQKINKSLENIEKGTDNFNQDMEALKHNFLFRGYFKKKDKQKVQ